MKIALFIVAILSGNLFGTIFGKDNRTYHVEAKFPYRPVGQINGCSGVLIDRDLILTSRHCVLDMKTDEFLKENEVVDHTFTASYMASNADGSAIKHVFWLAADQAYGDKNADQDWAIAELHKPLGDEYGWMQIKPYADYPATMLEELENTFSMAGYPSDRKKGVIMSVQEKSCSLFREEERLDDIHHEAVWHDCDSAPGSSGAPIFRVEKDPKDGKEKPFIYALNTGALASELGKVEHVPDLSEERTFRYANYASRPTFIYAQLRLIQKDREKEKKNPTYFITDKRNRPKNFPDWLIKEMKYLEISPEPLLSLPTFLDALK